MSNQITDYLQRVDPVLNLNYSTTETNTGRTYSDGKIIYRKVVDFGAGPIASTPKTVAHGVTGIASVLSAEFVDKATTGTRRYVGDGGNDTASAGGGVDVDATDIRFRATVDWSSYNWYVILEYTKT